MVIVNVRPSKKKPVENQHVISTDASRHRIVSPNLVISMCPARGRLISSLAVIKNV